MYNSVLKKSKIDYISLTLLSCFDTSIHFIKINIILRLLYGLIVHNIQALSMYDPYNERVNKTIPNSYIA